jgi:hypothetical protein
MTTSFLDFSPRSRSLGWYGRTFPQDTLFLSGGLRRMVEPKKGGARPYVHPTQKRKYDSQNITRNTTTSTARIITRMVGA